MGCDIHTYVEFADPISNERGPYWRNFTRNGGNRDYVLFGILAGVRVPDVQAFEPKGMPDGNLGWGTSDDYWNMVAPPEHPEWAEGDDWVTIEQAERWVADGSSVADHDDSGRLRRVSGPDWHSHSWLTTAELTEALTRYRALPEDQYPYKYGLEEWDAMLAAMRSFEAAGKLTRLVFWFDN